MTTKLLCIFAHGELLRIKWIYVTAILTKLTFRKHLQSSTVKNAWLPKRIPNSYFIPAKAFICYMQCTRKESKRRKSNTKLITFQYIKVKKGYTWSFWPISWIKFAVIWRKCNSRLWSIGSGSCVLGAL